MKHVTWENIFQFGPLIMLISGIGLIVGGSLAVTVGGAAGPIVAGISGAVFLTPTVASAVVAWRDFRPRRSR